jgi:hypothetical protein
MRKLAKRIHGWIQTSRLDNILGVWLIVPAILTLIWIVGYLFVWIFGGAESGWTRDFWAYFIGRYLITDGFNVLDSPGWFWGTVIVLFIMSIIVWHVKADSGNDNYSKRKHTFGAIVLNIALVFSLVTFVDSLLNDDKNAGRFYSQNVTFVVEDLAKVPPIMENLVDGTQPSDGRCKRRGDVGGETHDVPSCIAEGTIPTNWEDRIAPSKAARNSMDSASGGAGNTYLMDGSLTYIYGDKPNTGVWTAIRDGISTQSLYSVVEWNEGNNATECRFTGDYQLSKAFDGSWSHNMYDVLAEKYSDLIYEDSDIWGYCKGKAREPIIVVPVVQQVSYENRTGLEPAGVLVIHGSASGDPIIEHHTQVRTGELPGPVYPASMVAKQREHLEWAAGRVHRSRDKFGFEPVTADEQTGNNSEFLMRREVTDSKGNKQRRLFWVSPLTAREAKSSLFVGYAISPADEVTRGRLGEMKVYVPNEGNKWRVDLDRMSSRVVDRVSQLNPGFFSAKGEIVEFMPLDGDNWVAFGVLKNKLKYRFVVPANDTLAPQVTDLITEEPANPSNIHPECGDDLGKLNQAQLIVCASAPLDEMDRRQKPR